MGISEQIIPAAAVVAGSVLTMAGQALVGRGQRKHERHTKHWQEQRDAYADFRSCARRVRERRADLTRMHEELTESAKERDEVHARLEAAIEATDAEEARGLPDDDPGRVRRMAEVHRSQAAIARDISRAERQHAAIRNKLDDMQVRFVEVQQVMERAASVIDFTASARVRAAVVRLANVGHSSEPDDAECLKADQEYVEAVRKELKEWA